MPSELKAYDLVIIGGDPAGIVGAATAEAAHNTAAMAVCNFSGPAISHECGAHIRGRRWGWVSSSSGV